MIRTYCTLSSINAIINDPSMLSSMIHQWSSRSWQNRSLLRHCPSLPITPLTVPEACGLLQARALRCWNRNSSDKYAILALGARSLIRWMRAWRPSTDRSAIRTYIDVRWTRTHSQSSSKKRTAAANWSCGCWNVLGWNEMKTKHCNVTLRHKTKRSHPMQQRFACWTMIIQSQIQ